MNTNLFIACSSALLLAGATAVGAATVTGTSGTGTENMNVTMVVEASCDFSITSDVDFGTEGPVTSSDPAETSGEVTVTCTEGTGFSLALEAAPEVGGRVLTNAASDTIPYELALTAPTLPASGSAQTFAVAGTLGTLTAQPPVGTYTDEVTVTLTINP